MKKKIIAVVLIAGIGLGGWYIWKENSIYFELAKDVISKEEKKASEDKITEAEQEQDGEKPREEKTSNSEDQDKKSTSSTAEGNTKESEIPSNIANDQEAAIVKKYKDQFVSLKNEYQGKINGLLLEAKEEYLAVPEGKRGTAKFTLGLKYLQKGKALEDACDARFNELLAQMKTELKENGFTTDEVKIAQEQYKQEKSDRRRYLLEKMLNKD